MGDLEEGKEAVMALTMWTNVITGQRLDEDELRHARESAHRAYEANTHIFEDEQDALTAFGVMPLFEAVRRCLVTLELRPS
jgi:hypothetical protein